MSSYYTAAQLEEMRKEKLKKDLSYSLKLISEQLRTEHKYESASQYSPHIKVSIIKEDEVTQGTDINISITSDSIKELDKSQNETVNELDLSDLVKMLSDVPSKLQSELDQIVASIDQRVILTESDYNDYARIIVEVERILKDSSLDIEDKTHILKMKISSYLKNGTPVTEMLQTDILHEYEEYCALCTFVGEQPSAIIPYMVRKESKRLYSIANKMVQDEYIMDVIEGIMEDLGCHISAEAILDHTSGMVFSVDGHPLCDVFVGKDGNGIMFEPIAAEKSTSVDKKRGIEQSATHICSLYDELESRAAEKGVILSRVFCEPASFDTMFDTHELDNYQKQTKKRKSHKLKSLGMEE